MTPESKNKIGIFFDVKKISKYEVQMMIIIEFIKTCPKSRCKNKEVISLQTWQSFLMESPFWYICLEKLPLRRSIGRREFFNLASSRDIPSIVSYSTKVNSMNKTKRTENEQNTNWGHKFKYNISQKVSSFGSLVVLGVPKKFILLKLLLLLFLALFLISLTPLIFDIIKKIFVNFLNKK